MKKSLNIHVQREFQIGFMFYFHLQKAELGVENRREFSLILISNP